MAEMRTGLWVYPWDVLDEGIEAVLDNVQGRAGLGGINLAMAYHSGMFLLPHNPRRKVFFPQPSLYFQPDPARWQGVPLQPLVDERAATDLLPRLRAETARRGLRLNAWTVCLHNSYLGTAYPDCAQVTAFGDRVRPHLCPANPAVRAYARALVGDLLRREFDAVILESLEYMGYAHGYHHEMSGVEFTPLTAWFMGLCFCEVCRQGARADGVDADGVQGFVRAELERFFAGDLAAGREGIAWPEIRALAGGEVGAWVDYRRGVVTSLFAEIRAERPSGQTPRLEAVDFGPEWPLGADGAAWQSGFDRQSTAPYLDALHPCPYAAETEAVKKQMDAYWPAAPAGVPVLPVMLALPPQVNSQADLRAKMAACRPEAAAGFSFYNYGFMRLGTLDWIREALASSVSEGAG